MGLSFFKVCFDFCLIVHSWSVTMGQKHSLMKSPQVVPGALTPDSSIPSTGLITFNSRQNRVDL